MADRNYELANYRSSQYFAILRLSNVFLISCRQKPHVYDPLTTARAWTWAPYSPGSFSSISSQIPPALLPPSSPPPQLSVHAIPKNCGYIPWYLWQPLSVGDLRRLSQRGSSLWELPSTLGLGILGFSDDSGFGSAPSRRSVLWPERDPRSLWRWVWYWLRRRICRWVLGVWWGRNRCSSDGIAGTGGWYRVRNASWGSLGSVCTYKIMNVKFNFF